MSTPFAKYQALGNDFVIVDARSRPELVEDTDFAMRVLDRHRGIGGDDLILLTKSSSADIGMRIRTPSGGWLSMCGNGIRCLGRYARDTGLWNGTLLQVETSVGVRELRWLEGDDGLITADLDAPNLSAASIPTTLGAPEERVLAKPLHLLDGSKVDVSCVSVGNPHVVVFVDDLAVVQMERLGPAIERHPSFPEGVNVHAAQVLSRSRARIFTWERGAGLTLA
ncbi:MAG: diaminopimelate epimerase [Dehalococcoidia bacterium]